MFLGENPGEMGTMSGFRTEFAQMQMKNHCIDVICDINLSWGQNARIECM
jgi:hypothetical protein